MSDSWKKNHTIYKCVIGKTQRICSTHSLVRCQLGYCIQFWALSSRMNQESPKKSNNNDLGVQKM